MLEVVNRKRHKELMELVDEDMRGQVLGDVTPYEVQTRRESAGWQGLGRALIMG